MGGLVVCTFVLHWYIRMSAQVQPRSRMSAVVCGMVSVHGQPATGAFVFRFLPSQPASLYRLSGQQVLGFRFFIKCWVAFRNHSVVFRQSSLLPCRISHTACASHRPSAPCIPSCRRASVLSDSNMVQSSSGEATEAGTQTAQHGAGHDIATQSAPVNQSVASQTSGSLKEVCSL